LKRDEVFAEDSGASIVVVNAATGRLARRCKAMTSEEIGALLALGVWATEKGVVRLQRRKLLRIKSVLREAKKRDTPALSDAFIPTSSNMEILLAS
jgi:hypothetical protein